MKKRKIVKPVRAAKRDLLDWWRYRKPRAKKTGTWVRGGMKGGNGS
jgi:hypothetical protein